MKRMFRELAPQVLCIAALSLLAYSSLSLVDALTTTPDRPPLPKKAEPERPVPQIAGPSVWGTVEQDGRKVKIDGHPQWYVEHGEIRKDGKLLLTWVFRSDGRAAPGLYEIAPDSSVKGFWQWGPDCYEDENGVWHGLTLPDTLRHAPVIDK